MSDGNEATLRELANMSAAFTGMEQLCAKLQAERDELRAAVRELIDIARVRSLLMPELVRFEMVLRR